MPRRFRILHMLPNLVLGGGQKLVLRNILAHDASRFDHLVCTVWREDSPASMVGEFRAAGIRVESLRLRRSRLPLAVARLVRLIRRECINLVHTNNTDWDRRLGLAAARLSGTAAVNTYHSMLFDHARSVQMRLENMALRGAAQCAIAVSWPVRNAWMPTLRELGVQPENTHVIPGGVVSEDFIGVRESDRRNQVRAELGIRPDQPVFVTVSRIVPGKGHAYLLRVMTIVRRTVPDALLLVVGDGPDRAHCERSARQLRLDSSVRFLGQRSDVPAILGAADIFLFASVGEGLGLAVVEAMAASLPVVAFELPVLHEVMDVGSSGIVVAQGDAESMAAQVASLLRDANRRVGMGVIGEARFRERFEVRQCVRRVEEVYESAIRLARRAP